MMKLVVGGVTIAENLNIVLLPRVGDKVSITDINSVKTTYTVTDIEFSFTDVGNKYDTVHNTGINYSQEVIINATV